eukprot:scaffold3148_cov87-Skeletonema_dohrnii-CCMP3373.AAC.2
MRANKYFDCFEGNIDEEKKARNKLLFLYSYVGVKSIFEGDGCLRNALYQHLGVISKSICQMCSVCTSTDNFSKSVNEAKQRQSKNDQDRVMVNEVLKTLSNKCFACNDEECDGMKCIMTLRLLSDYGVWAAFVWNSYLSRGGGSPNAVAHTTPLLWLELVLRSPPFSSFLLQSSL